MRQIRMIACLLALPFLMGLLSGCGGSGAGSGSKATRRITIQIQWPTSASKIAAAGQATAPQSGQKAGRADVKTVNSILVEVYDGTTRVGVVKFASGVQTNAVDVPAKDLTFYANAFAEAAAPDYVTDPRTGQLLKGPNTPLTPNGDPHPVASAVTVVSVAALTNPPLVSFTLNNNIAKFVPVSTTFSLDTPAIALNSTIKAVTADGTTVLFSNASLKWSMAPINALETNLAAVDATQTNLTLLATGVVHVTVTDSDVNTPSLDPAYNQAPISTTIAYTITPRTVVPNLRVANAAGSGLQTTLPLYARSVSYELKQNSFTPADGTLDSPPPAPARAVAPTVFDPAAQAVSGGTLSEPLTYSGRSITLFVKAWSNADGTGALLAEGTRTLQVAEQSTADFSTDIPFTVFHVTGFTLRPSPVTINYTTTGAPGPGINTAQLQVTALLDSGSVQPIDPRTVVITPDTANIVALSYPASPLDSNGNPYLLLTALPDAANPPANTTRTVTITATDKQRTGVTSQGANAALVTVRRVNAGFGFD